MKSALLALTITGLAACSATTSAPVGPLGGQTSFSRVHADTASCPAAVAYIVGSYNSAVQVYDRANLHAGPCGTIGGFQSAQGLFVDSKGNLWVSDATAKKTYEFAPHGDSPTLTLDDPNGVPVAVAVDEGSGNVYVTEYKNDFDSTTLVEVYAGGSTTPTSSLSDPDARNGGFDAVDDHGNLYVTFMTQNNKAQVDRWIGGTGTPENLGLMLVSAGGIVTTRSGALAVCDPYDYRCGIFARGSTKMSHIFGHMGRRSRGAISPDKPPWLVPFALALDRRESHAYVASESLTKWRYPGPAHRPNHRPEVEIRTLGLSSMGIATSPASRPGAPF